MWFIMGWVTACRLFYGENYDVTNLYYETLTDCGYNIVRVPLHRPMSIRKSTWKDKDVKEVSDTAVLHYLVVVFHKLCGGCDITCADCCSRAVGFRY
jgi:hypothetical protein